MSELINRIRELSDVAYVPAVELGIGRDISDVADPERQPICAQHTLFLQTLLSNHMPDLGVQIMRRQLPSPPDVVGPGSFHDHLRIQSGLQVLQVCGTYQQFVEGTTDNPPRTIVAEIGLFTDELQQKGVAPGDLHMWDLKLCQVIKRSKFAVS